MNQMGCLKLPCRCEAELDLPSIHVTRNTITYLSHYYATGEDMLCDYCRTDPSHGMENDKRYHLLNDEAYVDRIKHFEELERSISKYIKLGFERLKCTGEYNLMPGVLVGPGEFNEKPEQLKREKYNEMYGRYNSRRI